MATKTDESTELALHAAFEQGRTSPVPIETPDGGKVLVYPRDCNLHHIPPLDEKLLRIKQHIVVHDIESFVAYVNKFKTPHTEIFGEPGFIGGGSGRITAKLDYHKPSDSGGDPHYLAHSVSYVPRYSEQWLRWAEVCKKPIAQSDFAEFIEEARMDIREPHAAQLLDIVRFFKASKETAYDSATYTTDGSIKIEYSEEVKQQPRMKGADKHIMLPELIQLAIPVYFRDQVYRVDVFLRFRVVPGSAMFILKLDRPDRIEDDAFAQLLEKVKKETEIAPFLGKV